MKEKHFAYKINRDSSGIVSTHYEFEEDKMVNLLQDIANGETKGIYWIFKKIANKPEEALCIIDCSKRRIYYHYSGEVEDLSESIKKLSK